MGKTWRKSKGEYSGHKLPESFGAIVKKSKNGEYGYEKRLKISSTYETIYIAAADDEQFKLFVDYLNREKVPVDKPFNAGYYRFKAHVIDNFKKEGVFHKNWLIEGKDIRISTNLLSHDRVHSTSEEFIDDPIIPERFTDRDDWWLDGKLAKVKRFKDKADATFDDLE